MSPTSTPRPCPRHEWHQAAQTVTSTRAANCYGRQNTEPFSAGTYGKRGTSLATELDKSR